jgi:hypothetical protein
MTSSEFINWLNEDDLRRELFRSDPVGVVEKAEMTIQDILLLPETWKNLRNFSMRDMQAYLRLLEFIAKHGPEMSSNQPDQTR